MLTVKYVPLQPHCFAFGGFEIQMISAMEAVRKLGFDASPLDPWSRDDDFDILHCWGLEDSHFNTIYWANISGKKVILTGLIGSTDTISKYLRFKVSSKIGRVKLLRRITELLDAIIVVNDDEAFTAELFGIDKTRIHIIPNIVGRIFYQYPHVNKNSNITDIHDEYVLCGGNICERKNQVNLAKACIDAGLNLVIVGETQLGEEQYAEQLAHLVQHNNNIKWIRGMKPNTMELVELYKNCKIFALPSFQETQPISALEAAVLGKPLFLAERVYAHQKYYTNAMLVDPTSVHNMTSLLHQIMSEPIKYIPDINILDECKEENVGKSYINIYDGIK